MTPVENLHSFASVDKWQNYYLACDGTLQSKAKYRWLNALCCLGKWLMPKPDFVQGRDQLLIWIDEVQQDNTIKQDMLTELIVRVSLVFNTLHWYINKSGNGLDENLRFDVMKLIQGKKPPILRARHKNQNEKKIRGSSPLRTYPLFPD